MNRKMMAMCSVVLAAGLTGGCAYAQESAIVRAKESHVMDMAVHAAGGAQEEAGLRTALKAPETYRSVTEDSTGSIEIITDAAVEIPEITHASVIGVTQHKWEEDELASVTKALLGDAALYDARVPESGQKTPLPLPFTFEEEPIDPWAPELGTVGKVYALAEMADGSSFRYELTKKNGGGVSIWMKKVDDAASFSDAVYYQWFGQSSMKSLYPWVPDGKEAALKAGMTKEEAKRLADDVVAGLSLSGMEAAASEPVIELFCKTGGVPKESSMTGCGYVFHYTRNLDGMPVTYTMIPGGSRAGTEEGAHVWEYEQLTVYVTEGGIDEIRFENRYDIGEAEGPVKLLPFSDVMEIYEAMMKVREADVLVDRRAAGEDIGAPPQARSYRIGRITLGYTRIYDPLPGSGEGVLIPVWDFFGEYREQAGDGTETTVCDENKSFLTINAVDGTIVDRWLGY